jgi:hypothetical protein
MTYSFIGKAPHFGSGPHKGLSQHYGNPSALLRSQGNRGVQSGITAGPRPFRFCGQGGGYVFTQADSPLPEPFNASHG